MTPRTEKLGRKGTRVTGRLYTPPFVQGVVHEKPGRDRVSCPIRPECAGCNMGAHGFLCHFADGSCLRCRAP